MPPGDRRCDLTERNPIAAGVGLALVSALAFGLTIPVLGWAGAGVGPFTSAALLYLGACGAAVLLGVVVRDAGAPLSRASVPPLLVISLAGAAIAPALLAWGLQRTGPVTGGLLLNLEAVWTAVLAWLVFREHLGGRVALALGLMVVAGGVLALRETGDARLHPLGVAAIAGATLAWAIDNTASRRLAEQRPLSVIAAKGALGALVTVPLALASHEPWPEGWRIAALLAAGATGYGASLRLYLLAQRRIGAARTGSVFALAPFIGAALGLAMRPEQAGWATGAAAVLFAAGVALHLSERHGHRHRHEHVEHEHPHRHDDGHHTHSHPEPVAGEHSHPHTHEPVEHSHEHGPDVHHAHSH